VQGSNYILDQDSRHRPSTNSSFVQGFGCACLRRVLVCPCFLSQYMFCRACINAHSSSQDVCFLATMSWFKWVRNQLVFLVLSESLSYTHYFVIQRFTSRSHDLQASAEVSILSVAALNPSWFTVSPVSYEINLGCLTVSILRDATQRTRCQRSDARLKTKTGGPFLCLTYSSLSTSRLHNQTVNILDEYIST
jgi:hypothetical protein